ncbi:unnamed protein product [Symbiodinium sp. CCMP2592]|nr:unnamed protein product [Symbiodinium sp. CCMP2592]
MSLLARPLRLGPAQQCVAPGFVVAVADTVLWASSTSWKTRSTVRRGDVFLASSFVKQVGAWSMLPVCGGGAVETLFFRAATAVDVRLGPHVVVLDLDQPFWRPRTRRARRQASIASSMPRRLPLVPSPTASFSLPPSFCSSNSSGKLCTRTDSRVMSPPGSPMRTASVVTNPDSVLMYVPMLAALTESFNLSRKDRNRLMHALVGNTPRSAASSDRCVGFSNPLATTCYVGSSLQSLLAVPSITESVASLTSLCTDAACPVCLLCKACLSVRSSAQSSVSLATWEPWVAAIGRNFAEYQDAAEILRALLLGMSVAAAHLDLDFARIFHMEILEEIAYTCPDGCPPPAARQSLLQECMLPVSVPACAEVSLDMLLAQFFEQAEIVHPEGDSPPKCTCHQLLTRSLRRRLATLSDYVLLDIKRQEGGRPAVFRRFEHIVLSGTALTLVGAVTRHGQHFMAHVRRGASVVTFNDACASVSSDWPDATYALSTVLLFAKVSLPPAPPPAFPSAHHSIDADAATLLSLYAERKHVDCVTFLKSLPLFLPGAQLLHLPQQLRTAIEILQSEAINAASALECRFGFSDSMLYPLAVLLEATAIASGMPAIFYIDTVHGLVNSLFHRRLCVNLGKFPESRSRYWFSGTGNVGDGKSPAVKPLVALLDSVLEERSHLCVGTAADRFHYQQSGTTAAAVDKLRHCEGYLTVHADEAGRCLCPKFAAGGETDASKFVDLTHFFDAAHGGEFSHTNKLERQRYLGKKRCSDPKGPVPADMELHIKHTNVHFLFLQQEHHFSNFFAQAAATRPTGLAQRFLFSFGAYENPGLQDHHGFFEQIAAPLLSRLFELTSTRYGPRVPAAEDLAFQESIVASLSETVAVFARRSGRSAFPSALPKSLYWLGTSALTNHVLEELWPHVLADTVPLQYDLNISDAAFTASVQFMHRRYLRGQSILAVTVDETSWLRSDAVHLTDQHALFLRILRGCSTRSVTVESCCRCDLWLKCEIRQRSSAAVDMLQQFWQLSFDLNLGVLHGDLRSDPLGCSLRKHHLSCLHDTARAWLVRHRIPLENWNLYALYAVEPNEVQQQPTTAANRKKRDFMEANVSDPSLKIVAAAKSPAVPTLSTPASSAPAAKSGQDKHHEAKSHSLLPPDTISDPVRSQGDVARHLAMHAACKHFRHKIHYSHYDATKFTFHVHCLEGSAVCPYQVNATYFRQPAGYKAGTLLLTAVGEHNAHEGPGRSGKVFTNAQEAAALAFFADGGRSPKHLHQKLSTDCPGAHLPDMRQLTQWLQRAKSNSAAEAAKPEPIDRNRVVSLAMELSQWNRDFASTASIADLCTFEDQVCLVVDVKMKALEHGRGVATASLLTKAGLRNTRLGEGRKQGKACASRPFPLVQAVVSSESHDLTLLFFRLLCDVWDKHATHCVPLRDHVVQVHKDFAPGLESARKACFPRSRPCDDFYHFTQKHKELESRLLQTELVAGKFQKKHLGWLQALLASLRLLPRASIFDACWRGLLVRLHDMDEAVVAAYLEYLHDHRFAGWWVGCCGIVPGTACGSNPAEAIHSAWQSKLESVGGRVPLAEVLGVMQNLYAKHWLANFQWESEACLSMEAIDIDPTHLQGVQTLSAVHRSPATELFRSHSELSPSYHIYDIDADLSIVAVRMSCYAPILCEDTAKNGVQLLVCAPTQVPRFLEDAHVLRRTESGLAFQYGPCKKLFDNIAYVTVQRTKLTCTCLAHALWRGCEHILLCRSLTFPHREADISLENVRLSKPRGRPPGSRVKGAGKGKFQPKASPKKVRKPGKVIRELS